MCKKNQTVEKMPEGCRGKCADLAEEKRPEAELQQQRKACHGDPETPATTLPLP